LFPGLYDQKDPIGSLRRARLADLDGDGRSEIPASIVLTERGDKQATSVLAVVTRTGKILWSWRPDGKRATQSGPLADSLSAEVQYVGDLVGDGKQEIVVGVYNYPEWAEGVYVISHEGKVLCEWWISGTIVSGVADLDADGIQEIIAPGVNNEPGISPYGDAIVAVLNGKTFKLGSSPQADPKYRLLGIPEGGASVYIRLLPSDASLYLEGWEFGRLSRMEKDRVVIEVYTRVTAPPAEGNQVSYALIYYTVDGWMNLLDIRPDDSYKNVHTAMFKAGQLSRPWQQMLPSLASRLLYLSH
jgi:hypothetical protein